MRLGKGKTKAPVKARQLSIREYRSKIAQAKKLGLISDRVDARSQKQTRHMQRILDRNRDVLSGKAKAVRVPKSEVKRFKEEGARVQNSRVIVPVMKGEKPRYSRKSKDIMSRINIGGSRYRVSKVTGELTPDKLKALEAKGYMFSVPFKRGDGIQRLTFSSANALLQMLAEYSDSYPDMLDYVEILEPGMDYPEDEDF